jgi:hypothetical protein
MLKNVKETFERITFSITKQITFAPFKWDSSRRFSTSDFFSSKCAPGSSDSWARAVSNINVLTC